MALQLKGAAAALALLAAAPGLAQPIGDAAPARIVPDDDESLQIASAVASVRPLRRQGEIGVVIFSMVGGDPAMNGEYVYLSFDVERHGPARIFRVGDVLSYRLVSETRGRVLLAVTENVMNQDGEIGIRNRRVLLSWTPGADGAPTAVTVATAR